MLLFGRDDGEWSGKVPYLHGKGKGKGRRGLWFFNWTVRNRLHQNHSLVSPSIGTDRLSDNVIQSSTSSTQNIITQSSSSFFPPSHSLLLDFSFFSTSSTAFFSFSWSFAIYLMTANFLVHYHLSRRRKRKKEASSSVGDSVMFVCYEGGRNVFFSLARYRQNASFLHVYLSKCMCVFLSIVCLWPLGVSPTENRFTSFTPKISSLHFPRLSLGVMFVQYAHSPKRLLISPFEERKERSQMMTHPNVVYRWVTVKETFS